MYGTSQQQVNAYCMTFVQGVWLLHAHALPLQLHTHVLYTLVLRVRVMVPFGVFPMYLCIL